MRPGGEPPSIVVCHQGDALALSLVLAGLEEEGVPARVERVTGIATAAALAHRGAGSSVLDVGVGIAADGTVCVHHVKLPAGEPALRTCDPARYRDLGHDAARIVKVVPLTLADDD
jgi:propanediol dehydratase medium subunit